jgi:hypothetical protein
MHYDKSSASSGIAPQVMASRTRSRSSTLRWGRPMRLAQALRAAFDDHSPTLNWLRLDPRMEPLRAAPCYSQAMQRLSQ